MATARPTRSALVRRAAAALAALAFSGAALAQDEPSILAPAARTITKAAPADRVVLRQRPVDLRVGPLAERATKGGTAFAVDLFEGERIVVETARVEVRAPGNYTYFGRIRGQPKSEAVLTFVDGYLSADIVTDPERAGGRAYRILSLPGSGHWLQEIDPAAFPPDHPGDADSLPVPRIEKLLQGKAGGDVAADSAASFDLMVVYSNQTAAAAGAAIGSQIQAAVDRVNLAYANSGVATRVRLVHAAQVSYDESGSFSTELSRLSGTADGYMDNVHALRNTYGADLVSLFVEASSACGIGYIGPSSGAAFTVVSRGCAAGNLSLAHEIGHNFGARHDPYVDSSISPYAYGHGYAYPAGRWRTVMAYNNACSAAGTSCTRIAYMSNPDVSYGSPAAPTGTSANGSNPTSDNARVHNGNAATVANFRAAVGGGCTYAFSPASASVAAGGGSGSTSVSAGSGCAWNTTSSASWLTVGAGSGVSGSGTLNYVAAANGGPARTGTLSVGGVAFTVSQANGCTYSVSPASASFTATGGSATVAVTTAAGCTWTASSGASWTTVTSGASGSGSSTVSYTVAANSGALRTANLTVAGKTVTITQAAPPCTYALSPSSANVGATGGSGSTSVTAGSGCAWNASSSASWLTVGSGSGTSGSGTLNYVAAANTGPARSATISVGGTTFTVSQASGCTYAVSPTSATFASGGGNASVTVTTSAGCPWTAASGTAWMTVTSAASGSGSGSVAYAVASNAGAQRSGSLTVAGATVSVTQSAAPVTPTAAASLTPTAMDFGSLQVGRTSSVRTAVYANTGTVALTVASIASAGSNPADFVARNACYVGLTLQPGQTCALGYAFSPKDTGARSATATIVSEAGGRTIALSGEGRKSNAKR